MLLIQEIRSDWTKQSRGGKEATTRNAVPELAPLPRLAHRLKEPIDLIHQQLSFDERRDFEPVENVEQGLLLQQRLEKLRGLWVMLEGDTCVLQFVWTITVGMPIRNHLPRNIGVLRMGEWAQVKFNGRIDWGDNLWRYNKTVYNIALVNSFAEASAVFAQEPTRTHNAMEMLR